MTPQIARRVVLHFQKAPEPSSEVKRLSPREKDVLDQLAKGYRYKDPDQANGPIRVAILRNGKFIKAVGKGAGLNHTLAGNPDPVDVVLQTGTKKYCMTFGGTVRFTANLLFNAKDAAAPGACP